MHEILQIKLILDCLINEIYKASWNVFKKYSHNKN